MTAPTFYTIHDLPDEDRPRERLLRLGPEGMATAELIAIVLGSGMRGKSVIQLAQELIAAFGSLANLSKATVQELCQVKGVGPAKAIQLQAAFTLGMRAQSQQAPKRIQIEHPSQAYQLLSPSLEHEQRECVVALLLDSKGGVIATERVSIGTLSESLIHPREVFYPAIRHKAAGMILAHNHPSGDPTPSPEDYQVTKQLIEAGQLLSIPLHDHLVIGAGSYVSMRQRGLDFVNAH